jgi:inosine-uridine nucleoside N-ribohydrolase
MRVILDCDPGNGIPGSDIDDGLALGLILRSREMELVAVTIVGGNTAVDDGVSAAYAVLEAAGATIPVHRGAARPLIEDPMNWRRELDGRKKSEPTATLWKDVPGLRARADVAQPFAAEAIVRLVDASPHEITLIAVGPLTNVAQAMLIDPELPRKVKHISIMGGNFGVPHRVEELNFGYDPEAARIVMASGAPITLLPLDTTLKTSMSLADNARLLASPDRLARFLGETTEPWIRYGMAVRGRNGCPLHDPLAVALLLDPSLVTKHRVCVDVELHGRLTRGRPVSWRPEDLVPARGITLPALSPVDVVMDVQNDPMVALMIDRLLG